MPQSLSELEGMVDCDNLLNRLEFVEDGSPVSKVLTDAYLVHLEDCPECRVAVNLVIEGAQGLSKY